MSTYLTIWHYLTVAVAFVVIVGGVVVATKQEKKEFVLPIILSTILIVVLITILTLIGLDSYTKKVSLINVNHHRILTIEKIVYTGFVKNKGNYTIGKVTFEVTLTNRAYSTSILQSGSYFKPNGFLNFFRGGTHLLDRPQTVTKSFVIATDLKPNEVQDFRVFFDYPPYFENESSTTTVTAH